MSSENRGDAELDVSAIPLTIDQTSHDLFVVDGAVTELHTTRQAEKVTAPFHIGCSAWSDSDIAMLFAQLPEAERNKFFSSTL